MSGYEMDEAMLAIQEAANGISSISKQVGNVEGKQDELLASIRALSERVVNLEKGALTSAIPSKKNQRRVIPLYERVSVHRSTNHCLFRV